MVQFCFNILKAMFGAGMFEKKCEEKKIERKVKEIKNIYFKVNKLFLHPILNLFNFSI